MNGEQPRANRALPLVISDCDLTLSDTQRLDWLQLIRCENVGPATFRDLVNHFGGARAALDALPEVSQRAGKKKFKICPRERAADEMAAAERMRVRYIGMGERDYPQYLRAIDYPPPLLCVRGDLPINDKVPVGMVGARNSSLSGLKLATMFAGELGETSHHLVSGFARGIDAAAHRAALHTGTIAVLAGGVDVVFPPEHDTFYDEMLAAGNVFVSEMPLGFRPRAIDFPRRNRIIAGISLGVIVIEAAKRSGSLITARLANEAGRLVFAVPGSPLDPRSAGANSLLKNGALVATQANDVADQLRALVPDEGQIDLFTQNIHAKPRVGNTRNQNRRNGLKDEESAHVSSSATMATENIVSDTSQSNREKIIEALGPTPIDIDDLVRHCEIPVSHVQLVLIELSLSGRLERHSGNCISLIMNG